MSAERRARLAVFGAGGVGQALLELLAERDRGTDLVLVADSGATKIGELSPLEVLARKRAGGFDGRPIPVEEAIAATRADVVVDVTSSDFRTGEPSAAILRAGLDAGAHVVTANKAALARDGAELRARARARGVGIGVAAATGAALPAAAVARSLARVDRISEIEGVLTGTTTFVLDELERGGSLEDAIRAARTAGIAEPDPSVDLGGWDTAAKLVILASLVWPDLLVTLDDVDVRGVEAAEVSPGRRLRIVGRACRQDDDAVAATVAPAELATDHPLAALRGRDKGVVFRGPAIGEVVISGGRSHPRGAAAAVLGDVLELIGGGR